ncbi:MAG: RNase adapter RapZ [Eubacteriaceae bacterium]|nr:RNase adapter RapZ [Eubacteriaceae bacterium]
MDLTIVTGMSGAGKSETIRALEDLGFYCVDNIPPQLIYPFVELLNMESKITKAALVSDIRVGEFFDDLVTAIEDMEKKKINFKILFLEADDKVLINRYKSSRRKHPLSPTGRIEDGILKEREKLAPIKEKASYTMDTTNTTIKEHKESLKMMFTDSKASHSFLLNITSFGFKYGICVDADLVFDVRFLPNPFYISELKPLSGLDESVMNYVFSFKQTNTFLNKLHDMLEFLIPYYTNEGKSQLIIAIGCTGGRHRSVAIANALYEKLKANDHWVSIEHRDITKDKK